MNSISNQQPGIRQSVVSLVASANEGVAVERQVSVLSALVVAERSLVENADRNSETRVFNALRDVRNFISLSVDGAVSKVAPKHTDLLPVGHPLSSAPNSMTASAARLARARWVAADPGVSEDAKALVVEAYSTVAGSFERLHAFARLSALTAGAVPVELLIDSPVLALVAAGGPSDEQRRLNVAMQWRDRFGRWVDMGRGVKFQLRRKDGSVFSVVGKFVGGSDTPGYGRVLVKGDPNTPDGVYFVSSKNGAEDIANLSDEYLKSQGIDLGKDIHGKDVSERFDADIQDQATVKVVSPSKADLQLASGELSKDEQSSVAEARAKSPIATLPAGMEVEDNLVAPGKEEVKGPGFAQLIAAKIGLHDLGSLDKDSKDLLDSPKSKESKSGPFDSFLGSDSPVSSALDSLESADSAKDVRNFIWAMAEDAQNVKDTDLADALNEIGNFLNKGYNKDDFSSEKSVKAQLPESSLSKTEQGKALLKETEKSLGRELTHGERMYVRGGLVGYGEQGAVDKFLAEVSAKDIDLANRIQALHGKPAMSQPVSPAAKAPQLSEVDPTFDVKRAEASEDYHDGYGDGFDAGAYANDTETILAKDGWSQDKVDGYNSGIARGSKVFDEATVEAQGSYDSESDGTEEEHFNAVRDEKAVFVWKQLQDAETNSSWFKEAPVVLTDKGDNVSAPRFSNWTADENEVHLLDNAEPYVPMGKLSDEQPSDFTDDPKQLSNKFSDAELGAALHDAITNGTGFSALKFDGAGDGDVAAEALYDALREQGSDPDHLVASIYDEVNGDDINVKAVEAFKSGTAVPAEIDNAKNIDISKASDVQLNTALGANDLAGTALAKIQEFAASTDKHDAALSEMVDGIHGAFDKGTNAKAYEAVLDKFLPWAFDKDEGKRFAFRALIGLMNISDGGDHLAIGTLEQKFLNSKFYDGSGDSQQEKLAGLRAALGQDGYDYKAFLRSKIRVALGKEDASDDNSLAGAAYRLAAKLQEDQGTPQSKFLNGKELPGNFARGLKLKAGSSLLKEYTTEGSVLHMDLRPFSRREGVARQQFAKVGDKSGDDSVLLFVPGSINGIDTANLSPFTNQESEILAIGDFKVTNVVSTDVKDSDGNVVRQIHQITLEQVPSEPKGTEAVIPSEAPVEAPEASDEVTKIAADISYTHDLADFKELPGTQAGSNKGGIYEDADGNQIYVKNTKSGDHADNEVLASALYEAAGVPSTQIRHGVLADGSQVIYSEILPDSKKDFKSKVHDADYRKKVQGDFAVDAWLANWDVAGLGFDNIITDANGEPVRVDPGGALLFRAQGAPKGANFNDVVGELKSLTNSSLNAQAAAVFGDMSEDDKKKSAEKLLNISDAQIDQLVNATISDGALAEKLSSTLKARRDYILNQYGLTSSSSETPAQNAPDVSPEGTPEGSAKALTGYDLAQDENGVNYPTTPLSKDDLWALANGTATPPALPFKTADTMSGNVHYYDSEGVRHWGQYGAAGAVLRRKNADGQFEFLLVKRHDKASTDAAKWTVPGGAHDTKADASELGVTAKRELQEEAGIGFKGEAKPSGDFKVQSAPDWAFDYTIFDADAADNFPVKLAAEVSQYKWASADELKQMLSAGDLHSGMDEKIVDGLIAESDKSAFDPEQLTSTKWWTPDANSSFQKKTVSDLQQGDVVTVKGSTGERDVLITSVPELVTNKNADGTTRTTMQFEGFNPVTGAPSIFAWKPEDSVDVMSGNQSAKDLLAEKTTPEAPAEVSTTNPNIVDEVTYPNIGQTNYDVTVIKYDSGLVEFHRATFGDTGYSIVAATVSPTVNGTFDVYVNLDDPANTKKASFTNDVDAQAWAADQLSDSYGSDDNFITGETTGSMPSPVVHKGGFLKPASEAQINVIKKMLDHKDLPADRKEQIKNLLTKGDFVGGEAGSLMGELKKYADLPVEQVTNDSVAPKQPELSELESSINPSSAADVLDPNLIMQAVKDAHPGFEVLANGDIKIGERLFTDLEGSQFKYELIVRRTKAERFFAYIRETNMKNGEVTVMKATKETHSFKHLYNKMEAYKAKVNGENPRKWFTKVKASKGAQVIQPDVDLTPELQEYMSGNDVPKTGNELVNAISDMISDLGGTSFNVDLKILNALAKAKGLPADFVNNVVQKMAENKAKAAESIPDYMLTKDGGVPAAPHVSYDGKTQVQVGDFVDWTDVTTGKVYRGQVVKLQFNHNTKDYNYSDQTLVVFPELNNQGYEDKATGVWHKYSPNNSRHRVSSNLLVVDKDAPMSEPFYAKAEEKIKQEQVLPKPESEAQKVEKAVKSADLLYVGTEPATSSKDVDGNAFVDINGNKVPTYNNGLEVLKAALGGMTGSEMLVDLKPGQLVKVMDRWLHIVASGQDADGTVHVTHASYDEHGELKIGKWTLPKTDFSVVNGTQMTVLNPESPKKFGSASFNSEAKKVSEVGVNDPADADVEESNFDGTPIDAALEALDDVVVSLENSEAGEAYAPTQNLADAADKAHAIAADVEANAAVIDPEYDGTSVKKVAFEDIKKGAKFNVNKYLPSGELKVGDIIRKGVGTNTRFLQVLEIEEKGHSYGILTRRVTSTGGYYSSLNGTHHAFNIYKRGSAGWVYSPTDKFVKSGYILQGGNPALVPTVNAEIRVSSEVKKQEDMNSFKDKFLGKKSVPSFAALGVPEDLDGLPFSQLPGGLSMDSIWKKGYNDIKVKTSNDKYVIPGAVVTQNDNSGVVTDTNPNDKTLFITWLSGPKAGTVETSVLGTSVNDTENWMSPANAGTLGVAVDTSKIEAGKVKIDQFLAETKAINEKVIAQKAAIAELNKIKKANSVNGSGAQHVEVDPNAPIDWTATAFDAVDSLDAALSKVKVAAPIQAKVGREVLIDAGEIEDNKMRVSTVFDKNGQKETRITYTMTGWAGNEFVKSLLTDPKATIAKVLEFRKFKTNADGSISADGKWTGTISNISAGSTYEKPIIDADGKTLGYVLLHRANKTADDMNFVGSNGAPTSYHNKVDIRITGDATPEQIELALKTAGIAAVRPALASDIQIANENRIISVFAEKLDGNINYMGELRTKALENAYAAHGVRAEDMEAHQDATGDVYFLMPEAVATKLAASTNSKFFNHYWKSALPTEPKDRAAFIFELLTGTGLRPTTFRWGYGVHTSGMSSVGDGNGAGANYVFVSKSTKASTGGNLGFSFEGAKQLRRLDWYANQSDNGTGKILHDKFSELGSSANLYEVPFKGGISWESLAQVNIADPVTRNLVRDMLLEAKITHIGSKTIDELLKG